MNETAKAAIVTGASQGIGAAAVARFRGLGYRVVATSRTIAESPDPDILAVRGDIGDPETGSRIVDQSLQRFGRIDTLVNNAGVFIAAPFGAYGRTTTGRRSPPISTAFSSSLRRC